MCFIKNEDGRLPGVEEYLPKMTDERDEYSRLIVGSFTVIGIDILTDPIRFCGKTGWK